MEFISFAVSFTYSLTKEPTQLLSKVFIRCDESISNSMKESLIKAQNTLKF